MEESESERSKLSENDQAMVEWNALGYRQLRTHTPTEAGTAAGSGIRGRQCHTDLCQWPIFLLCLPCAEEKTYLLRGPSSWTFEIQRAIKSQSYPEAQKYEL